MDNWNFDSFNFSITATVPGNWDIYNPQYVLQLTDWLFTYDIGPDLLKVKGWNELNSGCCTFVNI